jgi:putative polyhydroxyalkanoate system protein
LSSISIRRAHSLPQPEARRVAESVAAELERAYGIQARWDGDTLHFERTGVSGTLHLGSKEILLEARLGFLLMAFRDSIAQAIERDLDRHLGAAPTGKPSRKR